jgi:hypothetical protein
MSKQIILLEVWYPINIEYMNIKIQKNSNIIGAYKSKGYSEFKH